jgi:hypothetical protein
VTFTPRLHTPLGKDAGAVELKRVVDEGTAEQVAADENATASEAGLGGEGIGGSQMAGGGVVCGDAHGPTMDESPCPLPGLVPLMLS